MPKTNIHIRLPRKLKDYIYRKAQEKGMGMSEYVRYTFQRKKDKEQDFTISEN